MPLSLFVLALYVLLQSAPAFGWFTVDPKLTAFVGLAFVAAVVIETILGARGYRWPWTRKQA